MLSYPKIIKFEIYRQVLITGIIVFPLVGPILVSMLFQTWQSMLISFFPCLVISILAFQNLYLKMHNYCITCKVGVLSEDHIDCPRGSLDGIKHSCNNCGAMYLNGIQTNT